MDSGNIYLKYIQEAKFRRHDNRLNVQGEQWVLSRLIHKRKSMALCAAVAIREAGGVAGQMNENIESLFVSDSEKPYSSHTICLGLISDWL